MSNKFDEKPSFSLDTNFCDSKEIENIIEERRNEILNKIKDSFRTSPNRKNLEHVLANLGGPKPELKIKLDQIEAANTHMRKKFIKEITEASLANNNNIYSNVSNISNNI